MCYFNIVPLICHYSRFSLILLNSFQLYNVFSCDILLMIVLTTKGNSCVKRRTVSFGYIKWGFPALFVNLTPMRQVLFVICTLIYKKFND